ncbi:S8 family serine peptidase [Nonomuraea sp. M3C6]|uniref:S8 family serine peptidase n=1 Tax=Nonomuraea marmarensis TaxID=3351344 RepID=A0ABW7AVU8_9ACTN
MRRLTRTAIATALALFLVGATAAGSGAAVPGPRAEQWWFTAWAVQNKVWPITQGQGITVAVIDTGVEASIPDLTGVVLPGTNLDSGSGDGRTDVDTDAPPGHGTAMAGLIASQGRGTGFVGVAPKAKILPIVANHVSDMAPAIRYAADHRAKVVNISQVAPQACPEDIQEAVSYAIQHDVVIVAGAGNQGDSLNFSNTPANCAGVFAIGGLDARLRPYVRTQRQPYVAAAAPATGVGGVLRDGKYHTSEGGTSSATALTSAVVALVRSKFPNLSARDVVQRIMAGLRDAGPNGRDDQTGYGAVRPNQALTTAEVPRDTPNPVFAAYDKWVAANGKKVGSGAPLAQHKPPAQHKKSEVGGLLAFAGLVIAVLLLAGLLLMFLMSRNKRAAAAGLMPGYPGHGQPRPYGRPGQPPQQDVPPVPPRSGRPGFGPRQNPPVGPGSPPAPYGQQDPPAQPRS